MTSFSNLIESVAFSLVSSLIECIVVVREDFKIVEVDVDVDVAVAVVVVLVVGATLAVVEEEEGGGVLWPVEELTERIEVRSSLGSIEVEVQVDSGKEFLSDEASLLSFSSRSRYQRRTN